MKLDDLVRNNVKQRLLNDEVAVSMIVRLVQSIEIAGIAKAAGFDSLYIDLEHCAFSFETTSQICIASINAGITPFVRVPNFEPEYVSRILDCGAMGIIAPHVTSAADARKVIQNAKFSPQGSRSVTAGIPQLQFQQWPLTESKRVLNDKMTIIAMIEGQDALAKADEIAAVDGVDILMIGTNDFCNDIGLDGQFEHPKVRDAYKKVIDITRKHNKHTGIGGLASKPKLIEEFVTLGARYVSSGNDLSFLLSAAKERAEHLRRFDRERKK